MYSIVTSSVLMFVLTPGILIPAFIGAFWAAIVHAVVFYIVLVYASAFIPWWVVWVAAAVGIFLHFRSAPAAVMGGRR